MTMIEYDDDYDEEPSEPRPEDLAALRTLLNSDWFGEEMENANYHSAYQFLGELRVELEAKFV